MRKLATAALLACVGLATATISRPASAGVSVDVAVPLPGVIVAPPVVRYGYGPGYYRAGPRFFYPGYVRGVPYGYGFRYGYRYGYRYGGWRR